MSKKYSATKLHCLAKKSEPATLGALPPYRHIDMVRTVTLWQGDGKRQIHLIQTHYLRTLLALEVSMLM